MEKVGTLMYIFAIADKTTGEILHCLCAEDDGEVFDAQVKAGKFPIEIDEKDWNLNHFHTSLASADLPKDMEFGSKKFREEYRIFPSDNKTGKNIVSKCRLEKRAIKGKVNEVDGTIVEDTARYAEIIAESKRREVK